MELEFAENMILHSIMAGGFHMVYVTDVIKNYSNKGKQFLSNMVDDGCLYIQYAGMKNYGLGLYSFTEKGVDFYKKLFK